MLKSERVEVKFLENICRLRFNANDNGDNNIENEGNKNHSIRIENIRNCDIFLESRNILFYADVRLYKFYSPRTFNIQELKNLVVHFDTKKRYYELELPCLTLSDDFKEKRGLGDKLKCPDLDRTYDLSKVQRFTHNSRLEIDKSGELLKFEANFAYGFAGKFRGKINSFDCELETICRLSDPHLISPIQRSINRENDELKDFSREQYSLQFDEFKVPDGHENPRHYKFNYDEHNLTAEEEQLLHNLTRRPEDLNLPEHYEQNVIDCGLVSILLAICYDIRTTSNEPTCESGWTRSMLSATLMYFEPFESMREVIICFFRRALVYPLYRNFGLAKKCVEDAIKALQSSPSWLLKQLLQTHQIFATCDPNRELFNRYYTADYIRYVHNKTYFTVPHMQILSRNLKNVSLDVFKKHLRMGIVEIENELLMDFVNYMYTNLYGLDDDDDDNDDDEEETDETEETEEEEEDEDHSTALGETDTDSSVSDGGDDEPCSSSDTEENSVIEQRIDGYNDTKT